MSKKRLQIQRRIQPTRIPIRNRDEAAPDDGTGGRINQYTCVECGSTITCVHLHEGTTPMFLSCRATPDCPGRMQSHMYKVDQKILTPDHEWYKPAKLPRDPGMRQHVEMGGLMLRKIQVAQ